LETSIQQAKGSGQPLADSVRQPMEKAFGAEFSSVKVHTDTRSDQMNQSIQAKAFTTGQDIFFRGGEYNPESKSGQELIAHELTHVVQQTGSKAKKVQKYPFTSHITPLLQQQTMVQLRRGSRDPKYKGNLSSDSGRTLLLSDQELYAHQDLITQANATLANVGKNGSFIRLEATGGKITHEKHTLKKVTPKWVNKGSKAGQHAGLNAPNAGGADSEGQVGGEMALWSDCGRSSEAVTGSQGGDRQAVYRKNGVEKTTYGRKDSNMHQVTKNPAGMMANQIFFDLMYDFMIKPENAKYLKPGHKERFWFFWESVKKPKDGVEAQQLYGLLTNDGKRAFDKAAGINHYANPAIGEAYTMSSGYNFPGFKETPNTWNFHWAGVIMKDTSDNITLENYAVNGWYAQSKGVAQRDFINREWNFAMYGSVKSDGTVDESQTFHQDHLKTGTHGNKATTMGVRTDK
jgi:hypothetical protein